MEIGIWKVKLKSFEIAIIGVYRPPQNVINFNSFLDICEAIKLQFKNCVILGDFNIHINDDNNLYAIEFLDLLDVLNMEQIVKSATHKKGNILDLIIMSTDSKLQVKHTINGNFISDHRLVTAIIEKKKDPIVNKYCNKRNTKNIDKDSLVLELEKSLVELNMDSLDLDEFDSNYDKACKDIMDKFPLRKSTIEFHKVGILQS